MRLVLQVSLFLLALGVLTPFAKGDVEIDGYFQPLPSDIRHVEITLSDALFEKFCERSRFGCEDRVRSERNIDDIDHLFSTLREAIDYRLGDRGWLTDENDDQPAAPEDLTLTLEFVEATSAGPDLHEIHYAAARERSGSRIASFHIRATITNGAGRNFGAWDYRFSDTRAHDAGRRSFSWGYVNVGISRFAADLARRLRKT